MAELAKGKAASSYVLPTLRKNSNPSPRFHDLVAKAGYESWERIFQNLRASRATDLLKAGHPIKTISKWVGNSPEVLMAHYAQVTDSDFQKALGDTLGSTAEVDQSESPPFSPPSTGLLGTSGAVRRKPEGQKKSGKPKGIKGIPRWGRNRKNDSIGRAGLSENLPNRLNLNDLGQSAAAENSEITLNGTPSEPLPPQQDALAGLRTWAQSAAQDCARESTARADILRLLSGMDADQLDIARAKLSEIVDTYQVSNVPSHTAE